MVRNAVILIFLDAVVSNTSNNFTLLKFHISVQNLQISAIKIYHGGIKHLFPKPVTVEVLMKEFEQFISVV